MISNSIESDQEKFLGLRKFTFFWRDGTSHVLKGETAADALKHADLTTDASKKLDFYVPGEPSNHIWDPLVKIWKYYRDHTQDKSQTSKSIEPIEPASLVHRVASRVPLKPPRKMAMLSRIT